MKEIKNTTIYTKENVKKFLEVYYFEKIKKVRIILNIFIIITTISFFANKEKNTLDIITLIFALLGIIEVNTNILPRINYYKISKQKNSIIDTKVTYIFKKNNFKLNQEEYIDYNTLNKIIETDKAYYLYINTSKSLIVDKTSLTEDNINTLTSIFKEQVTTYKFKKNV